MPSYYSQTASGPVFQIRLPKFLSDCLCLSSLRIPLEPARKIHLREQANLEAVAARNVFKELRCMSETDLSGFSRQKLQAKTDAAFDTLIAKGEWFGAGNKYGAEKLFNQTFRAAVRISTELLRCPVPSLSQRELADSVPMRGLIIVNR